MAEKSVKNASLKIPLNVVFALIFFLASLFALKNFYVRPNSVVLGVKASPYQEEIAQWEQIVAEKPEYRDGWLQLVNLYYQDNDKQKAKDALQEVKKIDPNNEIISTLEKVINE